MQLFLMCLIPGFAALYLDAWRRPGWGHAAIGIALGIVAAYAAVYVLGNYIQADLIAEMKYVIGKDLAVQMALLRKSGGERFSPFPRRIYPTAFVTGMPRAD